MMLFLCHILVIVEMLLVNLSTIHCCSKKKYSNTVIFLVYTIFSFCIISLFLFITYHAGLYGSENSLFVFIGIFYLIPVYYMYDITWKRALTTICSSWIYSLLAFTISAQIAVSCFRDDYSLAVLLMQSFIYLITCKSFIKIVRIHLSQLISSLNPKAANRLLYISLSWFFTCICLNNSYLSNLLVFKVLSLVLIGTNALFTYQLLYQTLEDKNNMEALRTFTYYDQLTGLANRYCFMLDSNRVIESKQPFYLIFMDLDSFKTINDRFGHSAGDLYLVDFALAVGNLLSDCTGSFYRIAGDEFICIFSDDEVRLYQFLKNLEQLKGKRLHHGSVFLGSSYGYSAYPDSGKTIDQLMCQADEAMYIYKKSNKDTRT